ncbi:MULTISPECIES: nuclear transport factor 2 family protein [Streptomyces]|uniref:nuclear transport factor 2 family protein n=1 Tax=Streptomyces TaxID=1883 RepID=UPI0033AE7BE0
MSDNKTTVLTALKELFGDKDVTAVDRWVAADYRQHSSAAPDGPEGLRGLIGSLTDDVRHEVARVIAEGDLVAVHGVYYGFGPDPMVAFDLFRVADGKLRVADGKIVEHWDIVPAIPDTLPHGNGLF